MNFSIRKKYFSVIKRNINDIVKYVSALLIVQRKKFSYQINHSLKNFKFMKRYMKRYRCT